MDAHQLESIIEDAFQAVIGEQYPDLLTVLQQVGVSGGSPIPIVTHHIEQTNNERQQQEQEEQEEQESYDVMNTAVQTEDISGIENTINPESVDISNNNNNSNNNSNSNNDNDTHTQRSASFTEIPITQTAAPQPRVHYIDLMNSFLQSYQENFRIYQQNSSLVLRHLQNISRQQQHQQHQQHHYGSGAAATVGTTFATSSSINRTPTTTTTTSTTNPHRTVHRPTLANWFQPFVQDITTEYNSGLTGNTTTGNIPGNLNALLGPSFAFGSLGSGDMLQNLVSGVTPSVPTIQQFATATEPLQYISGQTPNTTCPITLEEFRDQEMVCRIKHCGHVFKVGALQNWFSRNSHCPICRYDIRLWTREANSTTTPPQNLFSP